MKLKPLFDKVVLKKVELEEKPKSGLLLTGEKEKPQFSEVVAVGDGCGANGKDVKMAVKVGDKVVTAKYAGTEVKIDDEEFSVVSQSEILAVIE